MKQVYRGFDIEQVGGLWVITELWVITDGGRELRRELHRARSNAGALEWIDAEKRMRAQKS